MLKNVAPANVLKPWDEVGTERARAAKTVENREGSASKIRPGGGRATQNRGSAAQVERQKAIRRDTLSDFFQKASSYDL